MKGTGEEDGGLVVLDGVAIRDRCKLRIGDRNNEERDGRAYWWCERRGLYRSRGMKVESWLGGRNI